ncbi:MAG: YdcF family protein [Bdellovibrionales bacterium]|jgi:uncharacterized SAM-binding protein YcdF (DUF218 family)|nr:YdcF family protein [Bdellovibrionales bacterium]
MLLSIVIATSLLALLLALLKRRKVGIITLSLSLIVGFTIGQTWFLETLTGYLDLKPYVETPAWGEKNAIIVLGSGTTKWPDATPNKTSGPTVTNNLYGSVRTLEAARLYTDCRSQEGRICRLILSGGDPARTGISEAEVMKRTLVAIGTIKATADQGASLPNTPEGEIVLESESRNTFQNARFSGELIRPENYNKIYLVTSSIHMKRAQLFFRHFGVATIPAPSDIPLARAGWRGFTTNAGQADAALHEITGVLQYSMYNRLGRNPPPIAVIEQSEPPHE